MASPPEAPLPRLTAPITTLCGIVCGFVLPWYYVDQCDEPPVAMWGINGEFLGKYSLVLSLAGAIAALVCAVLRPRSMRPTRSLKAWALSASGALSLALLLTLIDWFSHGVPDWTNMQAGIPPKGWFGTGIYVTLAFLVAGTLSSVRLLKDLGQREGR